MADDPVGTCFCYECQREMDAEDWHRLGGRCHSCVEYDRALEDGWHYDEREREEAGDGE